MLETSLHEPGNAAETAAPRLLLASAGDVPFIVEAIVAESRLGHFSCDCARPDVLRGLWHQIQSIVTDGAAPMPGSRNGAAARAFVMQVGQANAGFAILMEHAPGGWHRRLELFALATQPAYRGRGLARSMVRNLVRDADSAVVYARCSRASVGMVALLGSCGFAAMAADGDGVVVLESHQSDRC